MRRWGPTTAKTPITDAVGVRHEPRAVMYWIVHHFKTDSVVPVRRPRTPAGVDTSGNCRSSHYVELGRKALLRNVPGGFYSA